MTATLFIIAAVAAVANAGFLGGPAVVTPAFARISAPAYYTYHAPLAYHTAVTATAAPAIKAEAPAATKEPTAAAPAEPAAAPSKDSEVEEDEPEYDPNPSYSFSYDIKDAETGDTKTQSESLENGVVKGSYTVVDPDGVKRTVEYTADAVNGFNAVVNTEPSDVVIKQPASKTTPAPAPGAAAPTAAPAKPTFPAAFFHAYSTPLAYHAAVAKIIPAPVTKLVSSPVSYGTSHIYHPSSITYSATPVHHKVIYA